MRSLAKVSQDPCRLKKGSDACEKHWQGNQSTEKRAIIRTWTYCSATRLGAFVGNMAVEDPDKTCRMHDQARPWKGLSTL